MDYTFKCHQCDAVFDSFSSLARHKRDELDTVERLHREHPEWDLRSCFDTLRTAPLGVSAGRDSLSPAEAR